MNDFSDIEFVIPEPMPEDWVWLDKICGELDQDFIDAVNEQPAQ